MPNVSRKGSSSSNSTQQENELGRPITLKDLQTALDGLRLQLQRDFQETIKSLTGKIEELDNRMCSQNEVIANQHNQIMEIQRSNLQSNIMISGIPELSSANDILQVNNIISSLETTIPCKIIKAERIGKETTGKTRPIKVKLDGVGQRNAILSADKTNLKNKVKFKNVFINADLCAADQKENARLRQVKKKVKLENPEKKVYIKKNVLYLEDKEIDKCDTFSASFKTQR
jgi:hypothetical protein